MRHGSRRDALLYSLSANSEHGHRRTNDDKRRSVDIMLDDPEWAQLTDAEIASVCMVSDQMVANRRRSRLPVAEAHEPNGWVDADPELPFSAGGGGGELPPLPPLPEPPLAYQATNEVPDDEASDVIIPETHDWEAADLRRRAMESIRELARLPEPTVVLDAWMKARSYAALRRLHFVGDGHFN